MLNYTLKPAQSGLSLIESLIALLLIGVALLSIQVALLKSTKIAHNVNEKIITEKQTNNVIEDYLAQGKVSQNSKMDTNLIDSDDRYQHIQFNCKNNKNKQFSRILYPDLTANDQDNGK
ncbi:prepilin-type N-terminal cleavage/methylation domain-containing protein [Francisellaceae bacterium]|nr:prepilin-type N-terminal cleavage/methylation domain-containing protein [Francisellaceae bacterium]